jgi:hypothetical protein
MASLEAAAALRHSPRLLQFHAGRRLEAHRTQLCHESGATAMRFYREKFAAFDLFFLQRVDAEADH